MSTNIPLFTLSLGSTGSLTCTEPASNVYLLTLNSPPDNRLTTSVCKALLLALDIVECTRPPGVVITTSGISKFYSNGLDLAHATSTKGFWEDVLWPLYRRLLTYPMPTIALINGHAFAGGLMLAMYHDYRIFNPHRGFLCVNELEFGAGLLPPMSSIFRQKVPSPTTYRSMVLEAKRYNAQEALKEGIVDGLGGLEETLMMVEERGLVKKGASGVYGLMKAEMWRETLGLLNEPVGKRDGIQILADAEKDRKRESEQRVREWQRRRQGGQAKL